MRTYIIAMGLILLSAMSFAPLGIAADTAASASPRLHIKTAHFEFPPVFEGETVRHEFIVENKGAGLLEILNVESD